MATEERATYCRICEPLCGLVATVEDGRLARLRPDGEHPLSRGFACPKGIAMADVQNDPDRVLRPLRRHGTDFEPVSWDEALDDIGRRLRRILRDHGGPSVGWYFGNPGAFSYSHALWLQGFMTAIGSPNLFTAGSQDINSRFVASRLLYGSLTRVPIPDLARTEFLLVVGANPLVSHGSAVSAPRIRDQLRAIVRRGGRVVVVDPRRSETARAFEHLPVRPDGDAWLLLSLLHVIFEEGREDAATLQSQARGVEALRAMAAAHPPEKTEDRTGVPADTVRTLARDLAAASSAAVYGRTGSCLGRHGTLVNFLLDALNVVTGNLDRPGGAVFGSSPLGLERLADRFGLASYGRRRSRVGGFPDVLGSFPAALMAKEITTPGRGRLRAMFVSAGNPVMSVPDGGELTAALSRLDLFVAIDLYVNDTSRLADYVLPATTFLEREDVPVASLGLFTTPFVQFTEAVVAPYGEARQEWQIIDAIVRRAGRLPFVPGRRLGRLPLPAPERLLDLALRLGPRGDLFGLRHGLSLRALRRRPHGVILAEHVRTGVLRTVVRHRDRRVRLDPPEILAEAARLGERADDPAYPLRLIGLRELRSQNSWMHNSATLMRGGRTHTARVHPADAAEHGVEDGRPCRITSPYGAIELPAELTAEVTRGTVAVPHGWGHHGGGWRTANRAGGANVNLLTSSDPDQLETLAGMAHLNGVPIRIEPAAG
ncbi:molybdopterin-dependent oxidoreductase [Actinomadura sp. DC4]|uniref:molybdopterin-dependent oxidoreductase n=1 Tax=Actinomadura sp. DC4 TaxID=3055069 RepID=UPI0025B0ED4B|nr:molybdopterin-dependent oxidoreductase [Actinomadura sp. DC4]MDN3351981.1 molybdopterin-dependent oxidoreductase [Actinomadura sp. DC4]